VSSVEPAHQRTVAAFDFDGTLSTRDNFFPFVCLVAGRLRTARAVLSTAPLIVAAALRDGRRNTAKGALVRRTFAGRAVEDVEAVAEDFADAVVRAHLRDEAVERAEWHRRQGHEVVIVSASLEIYLRPIADRLGFDAVLGTALEADADGRLTGRLAGANVRRAEKARRLDAWLAGTPAFVWAYGDSKGDHELFERADRAIRVGRRARR